MRLLNDSIWLYYPNLVILTTYALVDEQCVPLLVPSSHDTCPLQNKFEGYARLRSIFSFCCITGLPLARTRRVWSTFSKHCLLSSNQRS